MDDLALEFEEVVDGCEQLPYDAAGLLLLEALVLPQVDGELDAVAVLQLEDYSTFLHVHFHQADELGDVGVVQLLLDLCFPLHSLVKLRLVILALVLVHHYLEGDVLVFLKVIALVDLPEAASSQQL